MRVETLTKAVKTHDKELFCKEEQGKILVCRKRTVWESHDLDADVKLLYSRQVPEVLFALTHNFSQTGDPIDLGIEPLIQRIKSIDLWSTVSESTNVVKNLAKHADDVQNKKRSKYEDMARELRGSFKKAFSDYSVGSLKKIDKRRNNKWV